MAIAGIATILLGAIAACAPTAKATPTSPSGPYSGPGWILGATYFRDFMGSASGRRIFNNPKTLVNVTAKTIGELNGWACTPFADFQSYAAMQAAFAAGSIPPGVHVVMYDNENWPMTPANEQADPATYEMLAARLVHSHGLKFLATPAADLANVLDASGIGSQWDRYVSVGLAGSAAKYADILNLQAQGLEGDTTLYEAFLKSAIAQAREANPNIVIYSGISTARSTDPNAMFNAVQATETLVTGYWLNVITSKGRGNAVVSAESFVNRIAVTFTAPAKSPAPGG